MSRDYAIASAELIASGLPVNDVLARLQVLLKRRGHSKLYPAILTALLREVEVGANESGARLSVARASDAQSPLVSKLKKELSVGASDDVTVTVDETLIGGAKLRAHHQEIDASYKRSLLSLYQAVTK